MLKDYLSCLSFYEVVTKRDRFKTQLGKSVIITGQHLQISMASVKLLNLLSGIQRKIFQVSRGGEKFPSQSSFPAAESTNPPNEKTFKPMKILISYRHFSPFLW